MRTTVSIDDELLAAARRRAQEKGFSLGQVLEAGLRRELATTDPDAGPPVPVFESTVAPRVDLTSNRAMQEFLDAGLPVDKLRW